MRVEITQALLGEVLDGKYRVDSYLARGAMGVVYRGTQLKLKRPVAIKVVCPREGADEATLAQLEERFSREAHITSRLHHPNSVHIYDYGRTAGGWPYLVMELLQGRTLSSLLRAEAPLPPWRAARIAQQIALSLAEAHDQGVVHRDLKPDNVFLVRSGNEEHVKVMDFGIARLIDPASTEATMTKAGTAIGTPRYMAPEQALGRTVTPATDLYALGVVLFEMLTGGPLFEADSHIRMLMRHVNDPPPALPALRVSGEVQAAWANLVSKLLLKDAEERPQRASSVAAALVRLERFSYRDSGTKTSETAELVGLLGIPLADSERGQRLARVPPFETNPFGEGDEPHTTTDREVESLLAARRPGDLGTDPYEHTNLTQTGADGSTRLIASRASDRDDTSAPAAPAASPRDRRDPPALPDPSSPQGAPGSVTRGDDASTRLLDPSPEPSTPPSAAPLYPPEPRWITPPPPIEPSAASYGSDCSAAEAQGGAEAATGEATQLTDSAWDLLAAPAARPWRRWVLGASVAALLALAIAWWAMRSPPPADLQEPDKSIVDAPRGDGEVESPIAEAVGTLVLSSTPAGADVYQDDTWLCRTPCREELPLQNDALALRVDRAGYEPAHLTVLLERDTALERHVALNAAARPPSPRPAANEQTKRAPTHEAARGAHTPPPTAAGADAGRGDVPSAEPVGGAVGGAASAAPEVDPAPRTAKPTTPSRAVAPTKTAKATMTKKARGGAEAPTPVVATKASATSETKRPDTKQGDTKPAPPQGGEASAEAKAQAGSASRALPPASALPKLRSGNEPATPRAKAPDRSALPKLRLDPTD